MAGIVNESSGVGRNLEEVSCGNQHNHPGEALTDLRSSEQLEHGVPSTSPHFWDMDDDDDGGPRTSQLYQKFTWYINAFPQIKRRELRSGIFNTGDYKWSILIYPQGCDVFNHLSMFLCVANHDKLLPGWSHFAQFTLAVVNKDPKRTKYSDTLHRFCKKEHDWGWKKFMELSKVKDGFIDANCLIVKAQVQVIRERADRPFRCLDCQYRRELIRVYLTNVEAICRRFMEQRRTNLGEWIEDKPKWSSFCTFWRGIDQKRKHLISREKSDAVLRVVVQYFFIENEVTSTLLMDSLYSGRKCLEWMSKNKRDKEKLTNTRESVVPMVLLEKDMFILVDDVLPLVERAAIEPLPPKDDKGPQDRYTKDGGSGEDLIKDTIEHDERRLTELGSKTIEIVALAQIFSKIEIAYQEVVALKRQEQLIREEEAECEQKAKHVIEKDKKSKKKQKKHKQNGRKAKGGKGRDEKTNLVMVGAKLQEISDPHGRNGTTLEDENVYENPITGDAISHSSDSLDPATEVPQLDSLDPVTEVPQLDSDDRGSDTDTSEHFPLAKSINNEVTTIPDSSQNEKGEKKIQSSSTDDSSSTCSTDSVPSVVINGSDREYLQTNQATQKPPVSNELLHGLPSETVIDSPRSFAEPDVKKEEVASPQRNLSKGIPFKETTTRPFPPSSPPQNLTSNNVSVGKQPMLAGSTRCTSKPDLQEAKYSKPIENPSVQQVPVIIPSFQKSLPLYPQSVSGAGRLGSDLSAFAPSYIPLSRPNAIMDDSDGFPQYYTSDLERHQPPVPIKTNPSSGMIGPPHSSAMPAAQSSYETAQQTTQDDSTLEFPHMDIINDLLDDGSEMERFLSSVSNIEHHNLNRQFSFPGYTKMWGGDEETSASYHDYVSSPLKHSGPLDHRGNDPELSMRNREPVGLSYGGNPGNDHELSMRTRNNEPDVLSYGGIPRNDPPPHAGLSTRNNESDLLSYYGGIHYPKLSMSTRNNEPNRLSYGGIPRPPPHTQLHMRMWTRNRQPDGLSYGGIPRNAPPPFAHLFPVVASNPGNDPPPPPLTHLYPGNDANLYPGGNDANLYPGGNDANLYPGGNDANLYPGNDPPGVEWRHLFHRSNRRG